MKNAMESMKSFPFLKRFSLEFAIFRMPAHEVCKNLDKGCNARDSKKENEKPCEWREIVKENHKHRKPES